VKTGGLLQHTSVPCEKDLVNASSLSEVVRQMKVAYGGSLVPEHFR